MNKLDNILIPGAIVNGFSLQKGINFDDVADAKGNVMLDLAKFDSTDRFSQLERYYHLANTISGTSFFKRSLIQHNQDTRKGSKKDLVELLSILVEDNALGDIVEILLDDVIDLVKLKSYCGDRATFSQEGDSTVLAILLKGSNEYDELLGGTVGEFEAARLFTFKVNHAKWRDRKVRRFSSLTVEAVDLLPVL